MPSVSELEDIEDIPFTYFLKKTHSFLYTRNVLRCPSADEWIRKL